MLRAKLAEELLLPSVLKNIDFCCGYELYKSTIVIPKKHTENKGSLNLLQGQKANLVLVRNSNNQDAFI